MRFSFPMLRWQDGEGLLGARGLAHLRFEGQSTLLELLLGHATRHLMAFANHPNGGTLAFGVDNNGQATRGLTQDDIAQITNTIFTSAAIDEILDPVQKRLAAAVEGRQGDSQWVVRAGNGFRSRLVQRLNRLTTGVPTPLKFDSTGIVSLSKKPWTENGEGNAAELSRVEKDGKPC